ncbi:MAG: sugar phosphate nucleotidyltransferase, partial [Candidatus Thorarchaeota archaeon]
LDSSLPNAIVVDSSVYHKESMKVLVHDGCIRAISKALGPSESTFTSIDLYRFSGVAKSVLIETVCSYVKQSEVTQWTEVAINQTLQHPEICVRTYDISGRPWAEIDTLEDLEEADRLFD